VCSYSSLPDGAACVDGPVPGKCRIGEAVRLFIFAVWRLMLLLLLLLWGLWLTIM
jgi:hypothetical protein